MDTHGHPHITVTSDHILKSMPEDSSRCMVAEAVKDTYLGATKVHVDLQTIRYTAVNGDRRTYLTPGKVQAALVAFDAGDPVQPFDFVLGNPIHIRLHRRVAPHSGKTLIRVSTDRRPDRADETVKITKIGGANVPLFNTGTTRRRFGIRGLRINQSGHVVQG